MERELDTEVVEDCEMVRDCDWDCVGVCDKELEWLNDIIWVRERDRDVVMTSG